MLWVHLVSMVLKTVKEVDWLEREGLYWYFFYELQKYSDYLKASF